MGFRIFFYRISKFIWGMSLADRPIICKTLQFLVTNIILSTWIQDSRLRKKNFSQTSLDSRLKVQGSEKPSSTQPLWIQDSRLKAFRILNFFNPTIFGFKTQGSEKTSSIQPLWIQDSRWKAWRPSDSRSLFGILNLESWTLPPRIQEVFLGSWILNLESYPLDLESWILPPWVQEVFLESWILNPDPLGFKKSFWDLESWL